MIASKRSSSRSEEASEEGVPHKKQAREVENAPTNILDIYAPHITNQLMEIRDSRYRSDYNFNLYSEARFTVSRFLFNIKTIVGIIADPVESSQDSIFTNLVYTFAEFEETDEEFVTRLPWKLQSLRNDVNSINLPMLHQELNRVINLQENLVRIAEEVKRFESGRLPADENFHAPTVARNSRTG